MSRKVFVLLCALGLPAGIGVYTFVYAKGYSYFSKDPNACANCHVMNEQFNGWQRSGHQHTAVCIDCHLPHDGLAKWLSKGDQGFRHSLAFTLQNFKEPIEITPKDRAIVQQNCVRCHGAFVHAVLGEPERSGRTGRASEELDCLHCHRHPGH